MNTKYIVFFVALFMLYGSAMAGHIAGGEMYYTYLGKGTAANSSKYRITLRLFRECNPSSVNGQKLADLPTSISIGIYKNTSPTVQYGDLVDVNIKGNVTVINKSTYNNCLTTKPQVCYQIAYYEFDKELPDIAEGYTVGYQTCCRSFSIVNVEFSPVQSGNSYINAEGATYTCEIPGTNTLGTETNSSPQSYIKDTTLICAGDSFKVDFSAFDPDSTTYGDSLSYTLCAAYNRGKTTYAADINYQNPPYVEVTYNSGYSGDFPLGSKASINATTGIISGTAPSAGSYVVNVCITEWRKGKVIGVHRKDFTLKVASCALQAAELLPRYPVCDSFTVSFKNESTNSNIAHYEWNFGDSLSTLDSNTSILATPIHVYKDTGVYNLSLTVTASGGCQDSAKSKVRVYPGFKAKIDIKGSCIQKPYSFADSSYSKYGTITNWLWNFGETTVLTDTSTLQNTTYLYPTSGQKTVSFWVENSNGCTDSLTQKLSVRAQPILVLNPKGSTLICSSDTIQLSASEQGSTGNEKFEWHSIDSIINPNSANPYVYPKDTATFYVTMTDSGCVASDSIIVNTVPRIKVSLGPDTTICQTDSIQLHAISLGQTYKWKSSNTNETVANIYNPWVTPLKNPSQYSVQVNLGQKCVAKDTIEINVYPYPVADAGNDVTLCYGEKTTLHASIAADKFSWSPRTGLQDSTSLTTVAQPDSTTSYTLKVYYTQKNTCPKPKSDTVTVTVIPEIKINAGNDTSVVVNQPLNLKVIGTVDSTNANYLWKATNSSNTYLNNNNIYNPTAEYGLGIDSITYVVMATIKNKLACYGTDTIKVVIFQTPPQIFVPSAFTPNGDGLNDIIKPIPAGVLKLDFFSIYNRFGQLLYTTSQVGHGWDGNFNGVAQPAGTYIYVVQGTDYKGNNKLFNKGTVVLIR